MKFDVSSGTSWKGDDDGGVRFGRKGRQWFALAIRERLSFTDKDHPKPAADSNDLDGLAEWFCEDAENYG